jgi:hypothetical protein
MLSDFVPARDQQRIKRFVDVFLAKGVRIAPRVPPDMVAGPSRDGDWTPWKAVDSPVDEEDVRRVEGVLGVALPPLFRAYLMHQCLLMTDFGIIRLPQTPSDRPLDEMLGYVRVFVEEPYWGRHGYVPFAYDGNDGGPMCFDTKRPSPENDYPVVFVDHERALQMSYTGEQRWDSFAALLDSLEGDLLSRGM